MGYETNEINILLKRMSPDWQEAHSEGFESGINVGIKILEQAIKKLKEIKRENENGFTSSTTTNTTE